jgi:hypothetical protein
MHCYISLEKERSLPFTSSMILIEIPNPTLLFNLHRTHIELETPLYQSTVLANASRLDHKPTDNSDQPHPRNDALDLIMHKNMRIDESIRIRAFGKKYYQAMSTWCIIHPYPV